PVAAPSGRGAAAGNAQWGIGARGLPLSCSDGASPRPNGAATRSSVGSEAARQRFLLPFLPHPFCEPIDALSKLCTLLLELAAKERLWLRITETERRPVV